METENTDNYKEGIEFQYSEALILDLITRLLTVEEITEPLPEEALDEYVL